MRRHDPGLRFEVTDDHLKLLRAAYVSWDDCEFGAPEIDPKRPYGNSSVTDDIVEVLGWLPAGFDEEELPDELIERCEKIHAETETVLQIVLKAGEFRPGVYTRPARYSVNWVLEGL